MDISGLFLVICLPPYRDKLLEISCFLGKLFRSVSLGSAQTFLFDIFLTHKLLVLALPHPISKDFIHENGRCNASIKALDMAIHGNGQHFVHLFLDVAGNPFAFVANDEG